VGISPVITPTASPVTSTMPSTTALGVSQLLH
jgi:hypothetical protein